MSTKGQSAKLSDGLPPKCKNCTLEEVAVLRIMPGVIDNKARER